MRIDLLQDYKASTESALGAFSSLATGSVRTPVCQPKDTGRAGACRLDDVMF